MSAESLLVQWLLCGDNVSCFTQVNSWSLPDLALLQDTMCMNKHSWGEHVCSFSAAHVFMSSRRCWHEHLEAVQRSFYCWYFGRVQGVTDSAAPRRQFLGNPHLTRPRRGYIRVISLSGYR